MPADAGAGQGLFENLHSHANGGAFAGALLDAARRYHGTAGRAFLEELVALDQAQVRGSIAKLRKDFLAEVLPTGADGQARRLAERFGLIAAGGALASLYGLTGWIDGEATEAAKVCYAACLERRGGAGSAEATQAVAAVDHFLQLHGASRFVRLSERSDEGRVNNRAGYLHTVEGQALRKARAFIYNGHALEAVRLGWDEGALFGLCPDAPWQRLDRKGAAFFGTVAAVTRDCVVYETGLRRYRCWVNNDGGAVPFWTLLTGEAQNEPQA